MRIEIESINVNSSQTIILGVTKIGYISGIWKGIDDPVVGFEYDVELNLPKLRDDEIIITDLHIAHVAIVNDFVLFRGHCEQIDDDQLYIIRFEINWLEMIEIESVRIKVNDGIEFSIPNKLIEIYPISH